MNNNNPYELELNECVLLTSGGAKMILKEFTGAENQKAICFWIKDDGTYCEMEFELSILIPADRYKYFMKGPHSIDYDKLAQK